MERLDTQGPPVFYERPYEDDARLAATTYGRAVTVMHDRWRLQPPKDCRLFVITDGRRFVLSSAPPAWRLLLAITTPLWSRNLAKSWRFSGGLAQRYGHRCVIGVKPVSLMAVRDAGTQHRLYRQVDDARHMLQRVIATEVAYAAIAALQVPDWLRVGLAMRTVDHVLGDQYVREETRDLLRQSLPTRRAQRRHAAETVLRFHAQAYWVTRMLDERSDGLLADVFQRATQAGEAEHRLASACGVETAHLLSSLAAKVAD